MTTVLVSAGDASGELHAAAFVEALRERRPDLRAIGIGGAAMEKAGVELTVHQRELAVGGLVEVLGSLNRIVGAWRRLTRALREEAVDLVVLVDSPDFNLPFARRARSAGIPILYYVSPQVWAWRRGRIRKIARRVDRLACIFPFEPEVYAGTGLDVEFVGHPLVDRLGEPNSEARRAQARRSLGLDEQRPLVLLLPGSRRNELRHSLGLHLAAARALHARDPRPAYAVALAPSLHREDAEPALARAGLPADMRIDVVQGHTHDVMRAADVAVTKPGTVTVELSLLEVPMVVLARINPVSAFVIRKLLRVPSWAMPNLIAGRPIVPEFLQEDTDADAVAAGLMALLDGPARAAQCAALRDVRVRLGGRGAALRAAEIAEEMLDGSAGA